MAEIADTSLQRSPSGDRTHYRVGIVSPESGAAEAAELTQAGKPGIRVLQDLAQASLGANGIASDTRNIAHMLIRSAGVDWTGLLSQHDGLGARRLRAGRRRTVAEEHLMSALFLGAVAGTDGDDPDIWLLGRLIGKIGRSKEALRLNYTTAPVPPLYRDSVWRNFFQATMPSHLRQEIVEQPMRWTNLTHATILDRSENLISSMPTLDTSGYDIYLTAEPKPVQVTRGTKLVHRYHDAIPFYAADTMVNADATKYHFLLAERSRRARNKPHFVCNSEPTRAELKSIWPEIQEDHAHVIPCAVPVHVSPHAEKLSPTEIVRTRLSEALVQDEERRVEIIEKIRDRVPNNFPYILAVAALEPKKNIPGIVGAFERAHADWPELKLIHVGNRGWKSEQITVIMRSHFFLGNLFHLESVPHRELQALYRHAHCLVFPSIAEGFGLPPVEALGCGAPSVCADIPSLRWALGKSAVFADPYDAAHISSAILSLRDAGERKRVLEHATPTLSRFSPEVVGQQWERLFARIG